MKILKFVDVGEGITEGQIRKWLVQDGAAVKEDQPIVQIETDKAVVNLPSPISGTVKIGAPDNTTVKIGDVIAWIGEPAELSGATQAQPATQQPQPAAPKAQPATAAPQQQQAATPAPEAPAPEQSPPAQAASPQPTPPQPVSPAPQATTAPAAIGEQKEVIATPAVRKLARDMKIDLNTVTGTGPQGRILENDVKNFSSKQQQPQTKTVPKFSEVLEEQHREQVERVPLSQTRKAIARNMEISLTIPAAAHMDLINATSLWDIVKREKPNAEKLGVKLTFLPYIIKAVVEALKENPGFNSSYDHDKQEIVYKKYYNIGLAAEAADGLKVIVIRNADKKSILEIARDIAQLSEKLKNQTITIEEMRDSTFTITNIGSLGGGYLSVPIINSPEVAILGVHLIRDTPMVINGEIKIGKQLPFSIVFDHRVVDGAEAVLFGNALIKYIEDPDFLEMLG